MNRETISDTQGIYMMILFIMGSALVLPIGAEAKSDIWIAIILAIVFSYVPLMLYARFISKYPGEDFFDLLQIVFGKYIGSLISLLYIWFALHLGSLVMRNFSEFIVTVGLDQTPRQIPTLVIGILCLYAIKEGIEVIGRFSQFFLPIIVILIFFTILILTPQMEINNILPVLYDGWTPVLKGAFSVFTFPFTETVIFIMVFYCLENENSAYKIYRRALLFGGIIILISSLSDVLVLGSELFSSLYFPAYTSVSRLNIGNFLQRLEIIVSVTFLIGGFVKVSICLLAASNGIAKVFNLKDYRFIATPIALIMLGLSCILYSSVMEMEEWAAKVWPFYAFIFEIILPVIVFIVAEIRKKAITTKEG